MNIPKIRLYPDPILRRKCDGVVFESVLQTILDAVRHYPSYGVAAPQLGFLSPATALNLDPNHPEDAFVAINPTIVDHIGHVDSKEGCLSLPGIEVTLRRFKSVKVEWVHWSEGLPMFTRSDWFTGHDAFVWQHEIDHLFGVLITDKIRASQKMKVKKQLAELEIQYKQKELLNG
jgi:peptide deformylase